MMQWIAIAAGGALGALVRYFSVRGMAMLLGTGFPYGTLLVNVTGSLAAGLLFVRLVESGQGSPAQLGFFIVGFLGAFTTFSAFSVESLRLYQDLGIAPALANVALNVLLCLAACGVGMWLARALWGDA